MCFHDKNQNCFLVNGILLFGFFKKIIEMLELWRWYQVIQCFFFSFSFLGINCLFSKKKVENFWVF